MTFDDFIKKYNSKGVDFDGAYGNQCVDLYRQYVKEVLGFPQSPAIPGAKDIWNNYLSSHFTRIANTPTGVPQKGDIIIWGSGYGPYGHVGIFLSGDMMIFQSFDQNDPVGTKSHIQKHSYKGVLGWLRPKNQNTQLTGSIQKQTIKTILDGAGSDGDKLNKIRDLLK